MARKSHDPVMNFSELTSRPIVKILSLTPITSVQTTLLGFFSCVLPAVYFLSTGGYLQGFLGLFFLVLASWIDFADGAIARMKNTCSPLGAWIDPAIDVIAQALTLLGVIFGAYFSTGDAKWLVIGLVAFLGQLSSNFIGLEYVHKFGFESYAGLPLFWEEFKKSKKSNFLDYFLGQIVMPTNIITVFIFTIRYFVILGVILHSLWLTVLILAVILNFRWIIMFILYALSLRTEKSFFVVVEVLKKLKK